MISYIQESIALHGELLKDASLPGKYAKVVEAFFDAFKRGNKVLVAGNGGSAADAQQKFRV
jgi:D-sedoheptulose 7-phosphate isomerase